jgi:hypothetical protein
MTANQDKKPMLKALPEGVLQESNALLRGAEQLTVDTDQEFQFYAEQMKAAAALVKKIENYHEDTRLQAHALWKSIVRLIDDSTAPLKRAIRLYEAALIEYRRKQRELQEQQRRQLEEAERKKQEDIYVAAAADLEKQGDHVAAAQVLDAAIQAPISVAPTISDVPKVKGISFRQDWEFDIIDAAGNIVEDSPLLPREYLMPNEQAIGKIVRALGAKTNIPGIRVKPKDGISKRV